LDHCSCFCLLVQCFLCFLLFLFFCALLFRFFFFFVPVPGRQVGFKMKRLSVVLETQKAGIELDCQDSFALRLACITCLV